MKCGTEAEMEEIIDALDSMGGSPISKIAEDVIHLDYWRNEVLPPSALHPSVAADGTSVFKDSPPDNVGDMIRFLKKHNPAADAIALHLMRNMLGGGVNVPDWINHRPAQSTFEFYEVKPASRSGKQQGREKIGKLEAAFGSDPALRHYVPGIHYSRRGSTQALTITKGIMVTEVQLQWEPGSVPGLIIYKICQESRLRGLKVSTEAMQNMFMAALMLMMMIAAAGADFVFG